MEIGAVRYRGYTIRVVGASGRCSLTIFPFVSDLPVFPDCQLLVEVSRGVEAIAKAKRQIDQVLTS